MPVLYVEDARRAVGWYERLGFVKEWEHQFEPGFPSFVSVARGRVRLYLSEHKGDARPDTFIHLYARTSIAWRKSSASLSMGMDLPDARLPS
ncbi:MAG TPA: glyoxalase superfamily protein [Gaiellaceae bacterium]|nr:glyoxalase superfamily protein [Gaiellaceae bacterium]